MHIIKTKDGKPAAVRLNNVISMNPGKDGIYSLLLKTDNGQTKCQSFEMSDEEAEKLAKALADSGSVSIA